MKRLLTTLGLAGTLALPVLGQSNLTSTVIFSVKTAAGQPQTRLLSLEAVVDPDDDGANIFWGWPPAGDTVHLTNGVAAVPLEPNSYTVTLAGAPGSFVITVPTNAMTYNAVDITTNLTGYLAASNGPATVIFPLLTMMGTSQSRTLNLAPVMNPIQNGTNIVWGPALTATPTNGLATAHLEPNGYTVTMAGGRGALTVYVPTDGGTYNGASLPSIMPSNWISSLTYAVSWTPGAAVVNWTDMNGAQSGDVVAFNLTADLASVTIFDASAGALSSIQSLYKLRALISLTISQSPLLTTLDLTGCTNLQHLIVNYTGLTALNCSPCTALQSVYCDQNSLTSLTISALTSLNTVSATHNSLSQGSVDNVLVQIGGNPTHGGNVDVRNNTAPSAFGLEVVSYLTGFLGWGVYHD